MNNFFRCTKLILISILFFSEGILAQEAMIDIVHLKNGSVIRGIIIEQVIGKAIKLQTSDKSIFVYEMDEIEKLTREPVQQVSNVEAEKKKPKFEIKKSGFTNITEFNVSVINKYSIGLHIINGYLFNPHFSLGVGVGVDLYPDFSGGTESDPLVQLPMFLDLRTYFVNGPVTPFLSFGAGYSLELNEKINRSDGALLVMVAPGIKLFVSKNTALFLGTGYRFQYFGKYFNNLHSIQIKLGATF